MSTNRSPKFERVPSDELMRLLCPGGFLEPLVSLAERCVSRSRLDVHLRANDEVQVYCGLSRILNVRRNKNGTVRFSAHPAYRKQDCANALIRRWHTDEKGAFRRVLDAYIDGVEVAKRNTAGEGDVQSMWSHAPVPWVPFDREAVLDYRPADASGTARAFEQVERARAELKDIARCQGWAMPPDSCREIDHLAVDPEGRLVLAELKDATRGSSSVYYTPFQLLQYVWEWHSALESVRSGLQDLINARVALGLTLGPVPQLTGGVRPVVCLGRDGRSDEVRDRYDRVLEVANRHLPPSVTAIETWAFEDEPYLVQPAVPGPLPDSRPLRPTFAVSLQTHLEDWRQGVDGSRNRMWSHWSEGIYPEYRRLAQDAVNADSVRLHQYATHLRSSQVFALNLFLPFREDSKARLSEHVSEIVGEALSVEDVRFEWVPPGNLLGEIEGDKPVGNEPATAVDVVLWCRLRDGGKGAVLLEVKLSETDFTHCKGRTSRANKRKDVCGSAELLFKKSKNCYLQRPRHQKRDRRYWEIFALEYGSVREAFPGADIDGPCPFAESMQQPMRNLAIAVGLEQDPHASIEKAWFGLCAHDDNPDVAGHWESWTRLLTEPSLAPKIPASAVVSAGEKEGHQDWAAWMRNRYRICPALPPL